MSSNQLTFADCVGLAILIVLAWTVIIYFALEFWGDCITPDLDEEEEG